MEGEDGICISHVTLNKLKYLKLDDFDTLWISVVPGSVQVPKNRTRWQKSCRTGPGTARNSKSLLEPEPEPLKALGQL